jgi:hypothetical protein
VVHADLHELIAAPARTHQQLGRHEGSVGVESLADRSRKQLERAVDIARGGPEPEPHQPEECRVVETSKPRVAAPDAIPADDAVGSVQRQQPCDLGGIELPVAVHEKDRVARGGVKPGAQRATVPTVARMRDHAEARPQALNGPGSRRGGIAAAVIDDENLEIDDPQLGERRGGAPHCLGDHRLLVVRREHRADRRVDTRERHVLSHVSPGRGRRRW